MIAPKLRELYFAVSLTAPQEMHFVFWVVPKLLALELQNELSALAVMVYLEQHFAEQAALALWAALLLIENLAPINLEQDFLFLHPACPIFLRRRKNAKDHPARR